MTEQTKKYIERVQEMVEKYKTYSTIIENEVITPEKINEALANYGTILFTLTAEYQRKKAELQEIETEYQVWWDEVFVQTRRQLNDPTLPASKWLSKQEIESEARFRNKAEYKEWQNTLHNIQNEVSLYQRLLDGWKRIDSILTQLSANMRTEMKSLSIEDRANHLQGSERAQSRVPSRRPVS